MLLGSTRQASWRDPEGAVIRTRTREMAAQTLDDLLVQLRQLEGPQRAARFAELAQEVSDCGTAREGGDLGELQAGEMMEEFEEAVAHLPPWTLSGVIETESGTHIILRTPTDYKPSISSNVATAAPIVATQSASSQSSSEDEFDPVPAPELTGPYRASHILVKHEESARCASWRDPDGTHICQRSKSAARGTLEKLRTKLEGVSPPQLYEQFSGFARVESDCASAKEGGDLGRLEHGEMMEEFEGAVACIKEGELSAIVDSESGLHLVLRTPIDYTPPPPAALDNASAPELTGPYRASHILVKHEESARCASWRDPDGTHICQRSKSAARGTLEKLRTKLEGVSPPQLYEQFSGFARVESDCASAKEGGDLGRLEHGEMMEEFEGAVACIKEGELSAIVDSESGLHLVLRTPIDYTPPPPAALDNASASTLSMLLQSGAPRTYRGSHILVKHAGSARCASWRDPDGTVIRARSQRQAVEQLEQLMADLSPYHGDELVEKFDQIAHEMSDSGTEAVGGVADTGVCEEGEMEEIFEDALLSLAVNKVSEVVLTDSGAHLILRTAIDRAPPSKPEVLPPQTVEPDEAQPTRAPIPDLAPMRQPVVARKPRAASSLGWPGRFESTKLHVLLSKRQNSKPPAPGGAQPSIHWRTHAALKAPRASSNALLMKVKELCGNETGLSAIASSPVYIQDEDSKFPCEVARENGLPVKVCDYLAAINPTAENYHRLIDAIEAQDWLLVLEIIDGDPQTTTIEGKPAPNGQPGPRATDVALKFGAPTAVLEAIASALPDSRSQLDEERERRATLSTWSKRSMEDVERFVERVCSGMAQQLVCSDTVRDEHKDVRMQWSHFEREAAKVMEPSARWWQGLVPTGLEAAADRTGVEASEKIDGTVAEQQSERVAVRRRTLNGDIALLKTLCERGRLRPVEMKHCIDFAITGVDDEASFWQDENLRAALQIDNGTPFATTEVQGLMPVQWAIKCRAPLRSLDVLLRELAELEKADQEAAEADLQNHNANEGALESDGVPRYMKLKTEPEKKNLLHLASESGAPLPVVQRIVQHYPEAAKEQDCNGRFPIQHSLDCIRKTEEQKAGCLSMSKLPKLQQVCDYLESLYPEGLQSYHLLKAVGGPKAYLNGGGAKAHHIPNWMEAQQVLRRPGGREAAAFCDFGGKFPLTYAVEQGAPIECVEALYGACPEALSQPDTHERICLHYLTELTPVEVVKLVLTEYPAGTMHRDKNERVPLMLATKVGVSTRYKKGFEAMREIEQVYTQQSDDAGENPAEQRDKYGKTVLHFITSKTPLKAVQMLVSKYPDALKAQDFMNQFAVQTAMKSNASDCGEPSERRCGRCAIDAMANPLTGFPTAKNAVDLWEACDKGEWDTVVRIADEDPSAVRIAREEKKEWAHFALQLVLCWNYKTCEIVPGRVVQKLVDTYPEAATIPARKQDEKTGKRMKPIDMAKKKLEVHKKKCIGCQDVIHALTPMDVADLVNDNAGQELPEDAKLKELTGVDPYHVEKHISDKDLRGTLLLFCKGEELDTLELMIQDATDRRLANASNIELPQNRGGADAAPTWDDLDDHREILVGQGYDRSWVTKERRKDFKNARLKRLRSKQVEFSQAVMQTENRQFRQFRETGEMSLFSSVSPADSRQTNVPASLVVTKREETARRTKQLTFKEATRAGQIVETRIDATNEGSREDAVGGPASANATGTAWDRLQAAGMEDYFSPG